MNRKNLFKILNYYKNLPYLCKKNNSLNSIL